MNKHNVNLTFKWSGHGGSSVEEHVGTLLSLEHLVNGLLHGRTHMGVVELEPAMAGRGRGTGGCMGVGEGIIQLK